MKKFFQRFRSFTFNLGLVEQAQIVASTAVIVIMVTIIAANIIVRKDLGFLEFVSIVTVGIIGFVSVYFSLKYGRQLEDQRRELEALNTVSQVVSKSFHLNYIFSNVLQTVANILKTEYGWLYVLQNDTLKIKSLYGTETEFFPDKVIMSSAMMQWIKEIRTNNDSAVINDTFLNSHLRSLDIESWVSVPLKVAEKTEGVLLLASTSNEFFPERKVNLISAFNNQIEVALNNAHLFDKLRESEERYVDLFENSPDMYHLVNSDGIVVSCNQTESLILGYEKNEIIGKPLSLLYPPHYREEVNKNIGDSFHYREEFRTREEQMSKKDGELIDVSVNTSLVYDDTGKPILMRCLVRDITEKKKLENKIMQAQKIDSIGNLAGGIAHDFNNILTSIMGASSIMRRRITSKNKLYPYVDIIDTISSRGKSLTNQLLTFARKTPVEFHPINIHDVLEETLRIFEPSVKPIISVVRNFSSLPAIINGDEGQIQQAFLNLFINARDAMPNGGTLVIETSVDSKDEHMVVVKIIDNGIGMTEKIKQQIFVPFFSTKEQGKGTGLGLSVVYGVVKSLNGVVTFTSEQDKGTAFTLSFPLYKDFPGELFLNSVKKIAIGTESVLIVDDEEYVRITLSAMLEDLGYKVTVAKSGKEAIAILAKKIKIDLILLDMTMPEISGKKVFYKIKSLELPSKVIISSGYSDDILGSDDFPKQVDGFLQKPYKIEELSKKIREVLDT